MKTRIFLAEDHNLVRQGIQLLLESEQDFIVVGEADNGFQAVKETLKVHPDVLIVDIVMPDMDGIEVTREVKSRDPGIKIISISRYDNEAYVIKALQAGASGYMLKKATGEELVHAVRKVMAGEIYLCPPLNQSLLDSYMRRAAEVVDPYDTLTKRERQVMLMAAQGKSNPVIARNLNLSVRTVEMHRANMLKKLNLESQTELVRYALKRNLVE